MLLSQVLHQNLVKLRLVDDALQDGEQHYRRLSSGMRSLERFSSAGDDYFENLEHLDSLRHQLTRSSSDDDGSDRGAKCGEDVTTSLELRDLDVDLTPAGVDVDSAGNAVGVVTTIISDGDSCAHPNGASRKLMMGKNAASEDYAPIDEQDSWGFVACGADSSDMKKILHIATAEAIATEIMPTPPIDSCAFCTAESIKKESEGSPHRQASSEWSELDRCPYVLGMFDGTLLAYYCYILSPTNETLVLWIIFVAVAFLDPTSGMVNIVLEYMDGGSLQNIVDNGGCDDEGVLASIAYQVKLLP
jgi:hypothetical protein